MQLTYFVVDTDHTIYRVDRELVEGLWDGHRTSDEFACSLGHDLRLITVLLDEDLLPVLCFFIRVELKDGVITNRSRIEAFEAMSNRVKRRYDNPEAQRQFRGWPNDWQRQLAVALDVPAAELTKIGLGGPLLMADLWGISLEKVIEYFEEAHDE